MESLHGHSPRDKRCNIYPAASVSAQLMRTVQAAGAAMRRRGRGGENVHSVCAVHNSVATACSRRRSDRAPSRAPIACVTVSGVWSCLCLPYSSFFHLVSGSGNTLRLSHTPH